MNKKSIFLILGVALVFASARGQEKIALREQAADVTIIAPDKDSQFGASLATGDVNGDDFKDLVIGAPIYNKSGQPLGGKVFIVYGRSAFPDTLAPARHSEGLSILVGPDSVDLGWAAKCGDINSDGVADILIGAPMANPHGRNGAGVVYLIYGSTSQFPGVWDLATAPPDKIIQGKESGDALGVSFAFGDINNDDMQELILGAYKAKRPDSTDYIAGGVYVLSNSRDLPQVEDLASPTYPVVHVFGKMPNDFCGWSMACGDVNGDMVADLLIGAYKTNAHPPLTDQGEAYLIFGHQQIFDWASFDVDSANVLFKGAQFQEHMAYSLAIGDLNADHYGDMIVGSRQASPDGVNHAGGVWIIYGKLALPELYDFATASPDVEIFGEFEGSMLGKALAVGDVNGDAYADLLIAAPFSELNVSTPPGLAYLLLGSPDFAGTWDLKSLAANLSVVGADSSDKLGASLACGDLNGDGYDDMIIAAPGAKKQAKVYIIFGDATTDAKPGADRATKPEQFQLFQNYPNPFPNGGSAPVMNSATIISYRLPKEVAVKLTIYDVAGRVVAELANAMQPAGLHSVRWEAASLPNGVYFCRVQAGQFSATRKLMLLQ